MISKYLFFLGKGGVGKSTLATLTALELSLKGKQVLLISMDPAHNLSDITGTRLKGKPKQVTDHLSGIEIDHKKWVKRYLNEVENNVRSSYRYLTAVNLDQYLGILQYSPGIEEYGLLMAFESLKNKYDNQIDLMVIDMPPTALALRFFSLAKLSLIWLEKLTELRTELVKKRELITKVKLGKKEFETDKILNRLGEQWERYRDVQILFENIDKVKIKIVVNPDNLSINESLDIFTTLKDLNISTDEILLNKVSDVSQQSLITNVYPDTDSRIYPQSGFELIRLESLQKYLDEHCRGG